MKKTILILIISFFIHTCAFSQWSQTGGPNGAYVNEIVQVGSVLILSAGNGGIYKSTDDGDSWKLSISGLPCNPSINDLEVHNGLVYTSVGRNGMYISNDEGETWSPINSGIENLTFYSFMVDGNNIYAGYANGGVYYSPDNGNSWSNKSNGVETIQFSDFIVFNSRVYAAGKSLYSTSNNGNTWIQVNIPNLNLNGVRGLTVKDNVFYASSEAAIFVSNNNLVSWSKRNIDNSGATITNMFSHNNTVYGTTSFGKYFYSNDNGINWIKGENTNTMSSVHDLFFINNNIFMGTNEGVYKSSDNGSSWTLNNKGISALTIKTLAKNNNFLFAGTLNQGAFRSSDNGKTWINISSTLTGLNVSTIYDISFIGNTMIMATGHGIYASSNNGDTWALKFEPGVNKSTQALAENNGVLVTGVNSKGVYLSNDNGETWNLTSTVNLVTDTSYEAIFIEDNTIIVSTHGGEIFLSTNLGNTWIDISIPNGYRLTYDIELHNNVLYAATTKGLMLSTNLGQNWSAFNSDVTTMLDVLFNADKIYAATSSGVYVATEAEKKWYSLCEGMGTQYVTELLVNNTALFAGTFNSSVWHRALMQGNLPPNENTTTIGIEDVKVCKASAPVDLFSKTGIPSSSKGTWTPTLKDGVFNPSSDTPGFYTFNYTNNICGCENFITIEVILEGGLFAGSDTNLTLCKDNTPINLFEKISGNPDQGGTWSPALSSGTNILNPAVDTQTTYTYTVSSSSCGTDSADITLTFVDKINAGTNGQLSICSTDSETDLFKSLGGTPDIGGTWTPKLTSGTSIFNPSIDTSGTYTYSFSNGNCNASAEVVATVTNSPNTGEDGKLSICTNNYSVNLFDSLEGNPELGGTWSPVLPGDELGVFNPSENISGIYTYTINSFCGMSTSQVEVDVQTPENSDAINFNITIEDTTHTPSINITVNNTAEYEFSMDGINFQSHHIFNNLSAGNHMVFGREIDGCGFFKQTVFILDYPNYFTPNGDGYHDVWQIQGLSNTPYNLFIFDRFGKLLKNLNETENYWNGTFNGNTMPANDYWFKIIFEDGSKKIGHFSLKR